MANAASAVRSLYRGVSAAGLGAGPAHAVYFATYEKCKVAFGGGNVNEHAPVAHALAGACATVLADGLQNPVDTVKQRLQIADSPYKGALDCVAKTFRNEGVRAFYRSYPTTLAMNVPFTAIHFAAYESAKTALFKASEAEKEGFAVQFAAGGVAGGLAAAATTPMDVVKTRMQTQCVLLDCDVAKTVETTYNSVCTARGAPKICPQELAAQRARSAAVRLRQPDGRRARHRSRRRRARPHSRHERARALPHPSRRHLLDDVRSRQARLRFGRRRRLRPPLIPRRASSSSRARAAPRALTRALARASFDLPRARLSQPFFFNPSPPLFVVASSESTSSRRKASRGSLRRHRAARAPTPTRERRESDDASRA